MPIITDTFRAQVEKEIDKLKQNKDRVPVIINHLSHGKTSYEIGQEIFLSERTIENFVSKLLKIFRCRNKTELVATALRLKMIE